MTCELWSSKLDSYADGELAAPDRDALESHLRACSACSNAVVERQGLKRAVRLAGHRYSAPEDLRAKVRAQIRPERRSRPWTAWSWAAVAAVLVIALLGGAIWRYQQHGAAMLREVADLHASNLASANPVEVVSSDRHTVKPWFQGKLPFTFDLPDLQGSDFKLIGGRVAFVEGMPAAHLLFQVRQHYLSAFILEDRGGAWPKQASEANFHVQSWTRSGLRYIVVSDVDADDVSRLSALLKSAAK
jgi:anti-sigma factor (TIGR02949 family)